jgi:response regulator RpfG family c-di-GMP phosphodiesterase
MVPIRLFDTLVAMIEVAQTQRPFTAREISRVEDIADVLAERLVVNGWFELPT